MFFSYDHLTFRYEPFPIGIARPLMEESTYQEFLDNYPPLELFQTLPKVGNKYSLSEKFNRQKYQDLIRSRGVWREFYHWIKSDAFIAGVMEALQAHYIDLGYQASGPTVRRLLKQLKTIGRGQLSGRVAKLRARFEFSMLPANGGHVLPHTDAPSKIVTLIVSMVREGEWIPAFGGGTDVNQPKAIQYSFNQLNRKACFEDMEVRDTYAFTPNQAVIFVKTFNSWHSVRPMTGPNASAMRKTLTINIEDTRN
jgi:hypothetical protein